MLPRGHSRTTLGHTRMTATSRRYQDFDSRSWLCRNRQNGGLLGQIESIIGAWSPGGEYYEDIWCVDSDCDKCMVNAQHVVQTHQCGHWFEELVQCLGFYQRGPRAP